MLTVDFLRQQLGDLARLVAHVDRLVADAGDLPGIVLARASVEVEALQDRLEQLDLQLHESIGEDTPARREAW